MKSILAIAQEAVKNINRRNAVEQSKQANKELQESIKKLQIAADNVIECEIEQMQLEGK